MHGERVLRNKQAAAKGNTNGARHTCHSAAAAMTDPSCDVFFFCFCFFSDVFFARCSCPFGAPSKGAIGLTLAIAGVFALSRGLCLMN